MKEFALFLARELVDQPDKVEVAESADGDATQLLLHVAEEDKGKIIGKQGKVIKALRAVVAAVGERTGKKVRLDVE